MIAPSSAPTSLPYQIMGFLTVAGRDCNIGRLLGPHGSSPAGREAARTGTRSRMSAASQSSPPMHESRVTGLARLHQGKVRDIYAIDERHMLIVTTDRLSAFDVVL